MTAGLIASLMNALNATTAAQAAKSTMDMNKKKETSKDILDDGLLSKATKETSDKAKDYFKTLSRDEKDELLLTLVEGGLSTREAIQVLNTGYISNGALKKLSPDIKRKISRMTGRELESAVGFGGDPDSDKDPKKKEQKKKLNKLREDAKNEQREWERQETEFQKNDPKVKRRVQAKQNIEKSKIETPKQLEKTDPLLQENNPTQKMKQGERMMKEAIKNGRLQEWEYQHVTPTSNIPVRP